MPSHAEHRQPGRAAPTLVALFVPARACLVDDARLLSPATAARLGLATALSAPITMERIGPRADKRTDVHG